VLAVSGTGKENIDFGFHDADKKNFYGLVKKKPLKEPEETPEEVEERMPAEELAAQEEKSLSGMLSQARDEPKAESQRLETANERINRLFKSSPAPATIAAPRPPADAGTEQPMESAVEPAQPAFDHIIDKVEQIAAEAEPSSPMEPSPVVETYGLVKQTMVPSGQETQTVQYAPER
jgi:hypothetical protein